MTLATEQALVDALPGVGLPFLKGAAGGSNRDFGSFWTSTGVPTPGSVPTTAVQCTRSTTGAFAGWSDPPAGQKTHIAGLTSVNTTRASLCVYDRLIHSGGLSGIVTTAQTTNLTPFPAIPRGDTTGADVELWLEVYTAVGATAVTATVSYTNSEGTAGRSATVSFGGSTNSTYMVPVPLQAGDSGVRSVQSVTLPATTGTAGNFGITLLRRLSSHGNPGADTVVEDNWLTEALAVVEDGACLALMALIQSSGVGSGSPFGELRLIQG